MSQDYYKNKLKQLINSENYVIDSISNSIGGLEKYTITNFIQPIWVDASQKKLLPSDVNKVIINNRNVTVILTNKDKGTSVCDKKDTFDPYVGFCIAYYKAKNKSNFKLKTALQGCILNADKKGYKQAILNNR
jgi:hypothetical protein